MAMLSLCNRNIGISHGRQVDGNAQLVQQEYLILQTAACESQHQILLPISFQKKSFVYKFPACLPNACLQPSWRGRGGGGEGGIIYWSQLHNFFFYTNFPTKLETLNFVFHQSFFFLHTVLMFSTNINYCLSDLLHYFKKLFYMFFIFCVIFNSFTFSFFPSLLFLSHILDSISLQIHTTY